MSVEVRLLKPSDFSKRSRSFSQSSLSMKRPWEYSDRLLVAKESRITVTGQVLLCVSRRPDTPTSTSVSHTLSPHLNRLPSTYP